MLVFGIMNRRGFLASLGKAVAGFTILPSATTYVRTWKAPSEGKLLWVLEWQCEMVGAPFVYQSNATGPDEFAIITEAMV